MNEKIVKALIEAGAVKRIELIASGSKIYAEIYTINGSETATTIKGSIKTWATIDSSARWVKNLGIGTVKVEMSKWVPNQKGLQFD